MGVGGGKAATDATLLASTALRALSALSDTSSVPSGACLAPAVSGSTSRAISSSPSSRSSVCRATLPLPSSRSRS
eukprot:scaffold70575_cov69-Phaeocystis_antarctica.AAC.1